MDDPSIGRARLELLLSEYDRALEHTERLWIDLTPDEVYWRPSPESSAIGWHLGHQAAVAHFMVRNLVAAEPSIDPRLDELMDSATPEVDRGSLPAVDDLRAYRTRVADRVRARIGDILAGQVGAPRQLVGIGTTLLTAIVDHEYQHGTWIGEVRADALGHPLPDPPTSDALTEVDGYPVLR
jgi:DinB superfamily